jgi:uncharacterized delta-60 repeat protein
MRRTGIVLTLAIVAAMAIAGPAMAAPGDLDSTFGSGGRVTTLIGSGSTGTDVAIQDDGKIVVAGGSSRFTFARYRTNGTLDPAFGTNGTKEIKVGGEGTAAALAIQADGKIVAVGDEITNGKVGFGVVRLKTDGSLDTTFHNTGKLALRILTESEATGVAIQGDGKIVVVGRAKGPNHWVFATVRFTPQGVRDTTFGNGNGYVLTHFASNSDDMGAGVGIQSDGKLVVAGTHSTPGLEQFGVVRYGPAGLRDGSFGSSGFVKTSFAGASHSEANAIQIRTSGKIVVAGAADPNGSNGFAIAQYLTDGSPDAAFSGDGQATTPNTFGAYDIARQSNGKLIAVSGTGSSYMVARFTTVGTLDSTFGNGGIARTSFGGGFTAFASGVAIQSNGKIVVAGGAVNDEGEHYFTAARYKAS